MSNRLLIIIDWFAKPFYILISSLKWGRKKNETGNSFIVMKFFGIGSITRIAAVMDQTGINKKDVLFITLDQNKPIIEILNLQAKYVKTGNPFSFLWSVILLIFSIWKLKKYTVLDMERASNLSGIFRMIISIGKPSAAFSFKTENKQKGNQLFISLQHKSAVFAIAEMFNKTFVHNETRPVLATVENRIIININAGNYLPERKFTPTEYIELLKILADQHQNWNFELSGLKSERKNAQLFKEELIKIGISESRITVIAGQYTLSSFIERLQSASLFITNDSGPLHLAYYFGVKTVGIWGPTSAELVGYKNSAQMLNLEANIKCSPCFLHPKSSVAKECKGELTCFKTMPIKEMAKRISSFVKT